MRSTLLAAFVLCALTAPAFTDDLMPEIRCESDLKKLITRIGASCREQVMTTGDLSGPACQQLTAMLSIATGEVSAADVLVVYDAKQRNANRAHCPTGWLSSADGGCNTKQR
jgi:hypothetical protein